MAGAQYPHVLCIAYKGGEGETRGSAGGKAAMTYTMLAASSEEDLQKWLKSLQVEAGAKGKRVKGGGHIGSDADAASLQGRAMNVEQLQTLEPDALATLRSKQLRAVLEHMGVGIPTGSEKDKETLVGLIVKHRQ